MQANRLDKRVISLDASAVRDETLAALETEIRDQHDDELPDIELFHVLVLDARPDAGLDSHATVFVSTESDSRGKNGGDDFE